MMLYLSSAPLRLKLERGDNLQLFIFPLLEYEKWLYNIIDEKNFKFTGTPLYRGSENSTYDRDL